MTDDFKNILFKYLTGSLEEGSPTYDEIFESVNEKSSKVSFSPSKFIILSA